MKVHLGTKIVSYHAGLKYQKLETMYISTNPTRGISLIEVFTHVQRDLA